MTQVRATPLARAAFGALVVASFLAFFYAQELKHRDPLVRSWTQRDVRFPHPGARYAHFHVTATVSGVLTAQISSEASGRTVDVVRVVVRRYRRRDVAWDGRTSAGAPAPPGAYRVSVRVPGAPAPIALSGLTLTLRGAA